MRDAKKWLLKMADPPADPGPSSSSAKENDSNKPSTSNSSSSSNECPNVEYKTSEEYCTAVNKWLWQCYYLQCFANTLPYALSCMQQGTRTDQNRNVTPNNFFPANQGANVNIPHSQTNQAERIVGREYILPPLWKRFLAEVLDFFMLLLVKFMVTYVAVDYLEIIDLEKYQFDFTKLVEDKMQYKAIIEMTSELIIVEITHRIAVCAFEAFCLYRGTVNAGGSTPGKSFFRLRVVKCIRVENLPNNRIRVFPAEDLGFGWALLRAIVKNFSMAFFQPACLSIFFFQHNRAAYDMIAKSIVVEDLPRRH